MPRQTSKATESNPWAALAAELGKPQLREPQGEGWTKAADLPDLMGCCRTRVIGIIGKMMREGRAERFQGTAPTAGGLVRAQVWYRLK
jgi:hypothetical protein